MLRDVVGSITPSPGFTRPILRLFHEAFVERVSRTDDVEPVDIRRAFVAAAIEQVSYVPSIAVREMQLKALADHLESVPSIYANAFCADPFEAKAVAASIENAAIEIRGLNPDNWPVKVHEARSAGFDR